MQDLVTLEHSEGAASSASVDWSAPLQVRKAVLSDIPQLLTLINGYARHGVMLPRTEFEMAENVRDFSVVCSGARILGCGALHFYTPNSGEVRSLAVHEIAQGRGIGKMLVLALEQEARQHGLTSAFAFTYIPEFFQKLGYLVVDRAELPLKAWKDCLRCPKFQACDETAMIKHF